MDGIHRTSNDLILPARADVEPCSATICDLIAALNEHADRLARLEEHLGGLLDLQTTATAASLDQLEVQRSLEAKGSWLVRALRVTGKRAA